MSFASLRLGPRVPAARAPHARPPPCYLRLARVMKAPPRPLSQKRAAEGLQGRVRRARVYVLSPAAGAARRSTPLPLRGPRASLERFTHYSDGFYGVFLPENVQNPCFRVVRKCLRLSEFLMGLGRISRIVFSFSEVPPRSPCRVRRSRDGGPEIRALIAAAVPWLARAMAAETRLLIGHTSLCAAAAAVRTPMIAHALVLHSRHRWKGDWRCLLGRGGPHACSVRQWCVWSSTHSPH